jgi:long-subunit fatty acid transport protein
MKNLCGFKSVSLFIIAVFLVCSSAGSVMAAGFALIEQSASGLGNAYAGGAASAEDASTISFNPAGMTRLSGVPDSLKGARIVAALTQGIDERTVLKQMSEHLPNIALPRQFVVMEELPKMGSGKIDFRSVTEMLYDAMNKGR